MLQHPALSLCIRLASRKAHTRSSGRRFSESPSRSPSGTACFVQILSPVPPVSGSAPHSPAQPAAIFSFVLTPSGLPSSVPGGHPRQTALSGRFGAFAFPACFSVTFLVAFAALHVWPTYSIALRFASDHHAAVSAPFGCLFPSSSHLQPCSSLLIPPCPRDLRGRRSFSSSRSKARRRPASPAPASCLRNPYPTRRAVSKRHN